MFTSDFCETLVLSDQCQEVGSVFVEAQNSPTPEDTGDFHPRRPVPSRLFVTPTSLLVCCVSKDVTAAAASRYAQKVVFSSCLTLCCLSSVDGYAPPLFFYRAVSHSLEVVKEKKKQRPYSLNSTCIDMTENKTTYCKKRSKTCYNLDKPGILYTLAIKSR